MNNNIAICVDNIDRINYRIDYITNKIKFFDNIFWITSDQIQADILENIKLKTKNPEKVNIIKSGIKILKPDDIATIQNYSINYLRNIDGSNISAILRADILPSVRIFEEIERWANYDLLPTNDSISYSSIACKVFCECWREAHTLTLVRKNGQYKATDDGGNEIGPYIVNQTIKENDGQKRQAYDIGYIGITQYYEKALNHANIWGMDYQKEKIIDLYQNGDLEKAAAYMIKYQTDACNRNLIMFSRTSEEYEIVKDLNLEEEYSIVESQLSKSFKNI